MRPNKYHIKPSHGGWYCFLPGSPCSGNGRTPKEAYDECRVSLNRFIASMQNAWPSMPSNPSMASQQMSGLNWKRTINPFSWFQPR